MATNPVTPNPSQSGLGIESAIAVSLALAQGVLAALQASPLTQEIEAAIAIAEGAIENLLKLQGQTLTYGLSESLRVTKLW